MANFEELKKKAAETAEMIADKSIELARIAADKTKCMAKIAKLKTEIISEKENLKKNYMQIGKLYYEAHKDEPEEAMAQACADIAVSLGIIDAKNMEIEAIRAGENEEAAEDGGCDYHCDTCSAGSCGTAEEAQEESACQCSEEKTEETGCCCGAEEDDGEEKAE